MAPFGAKAAARRRFERPLSAVWRPGRRSGAGRECDQHVAGLAVIKSVTRIHEDHSARNRWTGGIERAAACFHAIDGDERSDQVIIPQDAAIGRRIGPQVTVDGAGQDKIRRCGDRAGLRGAAAPSLSARFCGRRAPHHVAGPRRERV